MEGGRRRTNEGLRWKLQGLMSIKRSDWKRERYKNSWRSLLSPSRLNSLLSAPSRLSSLLPAPSLSPLSLSLVLARSSFVVPRASPRLALVFRWLWGRDRTVGRPASLSCSFLAHELGSLAAVSGFWPTLQEVDTTKNNTTVAGWSSQAKNYISARKVSRRSARLYPPAPDRRNASSSGTHIQ